MCRASLSRLRTEVAVLAAVLLATAQAAAGASLFDPALRFRTLRTEHFVIYFHQGEDRLAERLAAIAEQAWRDTRLPLGDTPPRRTHVVLADQSETANGWATPLPYNTIVLNIASPSGAEYIGNTDDWLRTVFAHEFTHIVHLDRSRGWARFLRGVFGRTPIAFPNLLLPTWQIEGLATYRESAETGAGRLHAPTFRAIEREAARTGALEPIDRVNGGLTDWPGGAAPYAYGVGFHAYLADRYGAGRLDELAHATAGRAPYFGSGSFEDVFGRTLGDLWRDYQASLASLAVSEQRPALAARLTRHGFTVVGPRFAPAECADCPAEIVYSVRTPHEFPAMYAITTDGAPPRRLTTRYYGSTAGVHGRSVVFDQQELRRNVGTYSDLYLLDRRSGEVTALTREERLLEPDLSPDGQRIVAVREGRGRRELVLVGTTPFSIDVLFSEDETQFDTPRWSPDGQSIAVARRRRGYQPEIVVVDVASKAVRSVATPANARPVTPTWRPDGRALIVAAEAGGDVFNLYELPLEGGAIRKLTHTNGGATWPDISPDGTTIVFVGYTVDGLDLFTMPYPRDESATEAAARARGVEGLASVLSDAPRIGRFIPPTAMTSPASYSPWSTVRPTSWSPIVESLSEQLRVGVATSGYDVLGYHVYALSATWLVEGPAGAVRPSPWAPDWAIAYAYDRWRPTFFVSASQDTSFFLAAVDDDEPQRATSREREIEAGILFPVRRVRLSNRLFASLGRSIGDFTLPNGVRSIERVSARIGFAMSTARSYGYSISAEDGIRLGVTAERAQPDLAASEQASTLTADLRAYVPGVSRHHVVALRAGAGVSHGDAALGRSFTMGGSAGDIDVLSFARDAFSLMRGFSTNTFAGRRIVAFNAEYRWPIARPQRGFRTWPFFLHTVHAAMFADAGHAWSRRFDARDMKTSVGGELSFHLVLGYVLPLTVTGGAAWGRDGARAVAGGGTAFIRVGPSF